MGDDTGFWVSEFNPEADQTNARAVMRQPGVRNVIKS